jgi:hypothetical protein
MIGVSDIRLIAHARKLANTHAKSKAWTLAKPKHIHKMGLAHRPKLWLKRGIRTLSESWPEVPRGALLIISETHNQKTALESVSDKCKNMVTLVQVKGDTEPDAVGVVGGSQKKLATLRCMDMLSMVDWDRNPRDDAWRSSFCKALESGYYLQATGARYLLVSNDHSALPYHAIHMANAMGIPSGYVQHAPVTHLFPPLATDAAFLDGMRAVDVYASVAQTTDTKHRPTVFLTGIQRRIRPSEGKALGVAVNKLDRVTPALLEAITHLGSTSRIILRPHPAMQESALAEWIAFAATCGADISLPAIESSTRFLERIETLLAGNTGLHLEAALAGITCYQWPAENGVPDDYYGFQSLGLVQPWAHTSQEKQTPTVAQLRHWSHTYDTPWAGYEAQLVAALIANRIHTGSYKPESVGMRRMPRSDGWCVWEPDPTQKPENLFPNALRIPA